MERIVLLGGGGHCAVVVEALRAAGELEPSAVLDPAHVGEDVLGVPIESEERLFEQHEGGVRLAFVTVGSVGDPAIRVRLAERVREAGLEMPVIVHPTATVSPSASIGAGAFIAAGSVVSARVRIGECAIVNTGAVVDHDCEVGAFGHIAPNAAMSGAVHVGDRTHVGTGCSIVQGIRIGDDTIVGAGSVVLEDLPSGVVAYGNPCKVTGDNVQA